MVVRCSYGKISKKLQIGGEGILYIQHRNKRLETLN